MSEPGPLSAIPKTSRPILLIIAGGIALAAFLVGFLPMWIRVGQCDDELLQLRHRGVVVNLQNTLGSATIDARRGQYEAARQQTSEFFTGLRAQTDRGVHSAFRSAHSEPLAALLAQRDDLITLLARSDPASADRLAELYLAYRNAIKPDSPEAEQAERSSRKKTAGPQSSNLSRGLETGIS